MSPFDGSGYEELARFMGGALYDQLTSTEKSEEYGVEFLTIALGDRRKNYAILRKISKYFGEIMADKMRASEGRSLSDRDKQNMTRASVREAYTKWDEEDGQGN